MSNHKLNILSLVFVSSLLLGCGGEDQGTGLSQVGEDGATSLTQQLNETVNSLPLEALSADEEASLRFMREEEKLARDVYTTLYNTHGQSIFNNIAKSEQTHTDAVKNLLDKYNVADPVTTDVIGQFENADLQDIYNTKIDTGKASLIEALKLGALIEEIDIKDIKDAQDAYIDNQDINLVYDNLRKGSRNHLRSFVKTLENQGVTYVPSVISQADYDAIINSAMEAG